MNDPSQSDRRIPSLADIRATILRVYNELPENEVDQALARSRCPGDDGVVHLTIDHDDGGWTTCSFDPSKQSIEEYIQEAAPRMQRILRKKLLLKDAERADRDAHEELLERVRDAIAKKGRHAKPDAIIAEAQIARKRGRECLRELEAAGEYDGFVRAKPKRYR